MNMKQDIAKLIAGVWIMSSTFNRCKIFIFISKTLINKGVGVPTVMMDRECPKVNVF